MPKKKKVQEYTHCKVVPKRKGARTKVLCKHKRWTSCTDHPLFINCPDCIALMKGTVAVDTETTGTDPASAFAGIDLSSDPTVLANFVPGSISEGVFAQVAQKLAEACGVPAKMLGFSVDQDGKVAPVKP